MKRSVAVVTWFFALSILVLAHGNEKHVMGKVTSISDKSITVETTTKQSVTVELAEQTKFEKSGSPASLKDLKVGDRVVIHASCRQAGRKRGSLWTDEEQAAHRRHEGDGPQVTQVALYSRAYALTN